MLAVSLLLLLLLLLLVIHSDSAEVVGAYTERGCLEIFFTHSIRRASPGERIGRIPHNSLCRNLHSNEELSVLAV